MPLNSAVRGLLLSSGGSIFPWFFMYLGVCVAVFSFVLADTSSNLHLSSRERYCFLGSAYSWYFLQPCMDTCSTLLTLNSWQNSETCLASLVVTTHRTGYWKPPLCFFRWWCCSSSFRVSLVHRPWPVWEGCLLGLSCCCTRCWGMGGFSTWGTGVTHGPGGEPQMRFSQQCERASCWV